MRNTLAWVKKSQGYPDKWMVFGIYIKRIEYFNTWSDAIEYAIKHIRTRGPQTF